jgi:hypothetical protein
MSRWVFIDGRFASGGSECTYWIDIDRRSVEFINTVTSTKFQEQLPKLEGRPKNKLIDEHPHMLDPLNNRITLYESWNKPEKADEWRAKLRQTEALRKRHYTFIKSRKTPQFTW